MTRNRDISNRWTIWQSAKPGHVKGWQGQSRPPERHPRERLNADVSPSSFPPSPANQITPQHQGTSTLGSPPPSKQPRNRKGRFSLSWQFWAAIIVLIFGSVGFTAVALLLKLPSVPNCPSTFWPTASASMRLYCAQLAGNKQTTDDLLEAIALVAALPEDHPLRPEINRYIEQWSMDILAIGEQKFQAGQIEEAIKIAKRIPSGVAAQKLVKQQIDRWQDIWAKAEAIYEKAEEQLRESNWNQAFREAVKLTSIDNQHWATFKYNQLLDLIQIAREDSQKLDKAYRLSKSGRVEDLLAAIKEAEKISPKSFAYKEAQDLIAESGNKLFKLALNQIKERRWQNALDIANKIPDSAKLPEVKSDLIDLANAIARAESGNLGDLEVAIALAQNLTSDRPLYNESQDLIDRWQREMDDVARLERARVFASSGLVNDLRLAISEAQQIPRVNPRYQEARTSIGEWTRQIETIEDRPYLDRATQLASFGGLASLQDAVQEARRITSGRALYKEAQAKISEWTRTIQQMQDQPYLDQARTLANSGNLNGAISAAQQIKSGRVLSSEAQNNIRRWQTEVRGQELLQQAYQTANPGTPDAIAQAIALASQVPKAAKVRGEASTAIERWSYQLLAMAQDRSSYNVTEAIAIAKRIPSYTEAHEAARLQIQAWERSLEPPPPILELPSGTDAQLTPEHQLLNGN
ncbi:MULTISPECIES: chromosome segregation ATPase [unclassified Coleofasciculus]|uniref:chromosome segregation ATPase n=1 Tax=unclassified Coleofasciculus TaxID=2692782 RepID=UPI001880A7F5|nr:MULTISPECIES: chromosome segregation ATPase [unclassified Coleofasciculus]MBE9127594.1 chromosome segregation ATPase [Coleofasciculus sp. LEGE 07081]MBE9150935.1 chromosome segregation ATPase [Coleofasciculus sp. LEGE 07092]